MGVLILVILVPVHFFSGRWERTHRDQLLALNAEAERTSRQGDQKAALSKYDDLFRMVGDRSIDDPNLREAIVAARATRAMVAAKVQKLDLAEQAEMIEFLRESRADMEAGRTKPALAALDKLAKKHKLKTKVK